MSSKNNRTNRSDVVMGLVNVGFNPGDAENVIKTMVDLAVDPDLNLSVKARGYFDAVRLIFEGQQMKVVGHQKIQEGKCALQLLDGNVNAQGRKSNTVRGGDDVMQTVASSISTSQSAKSVPESRKTAAERSRTKYVEYQKTKPADPDVKVKVLKAIKSIHRPSNNRVQRAVFGKVGTSEYYNVRAAVRELLAEKRIVPCEGTASTGHHYPSWTATS